LGKRKMAMHAARRSKKTSEGWGTWTVKRLRHVKLIGRGSERGHAMPRMQGLMLLGKENILVVLSRAFYLLPAF
jgi:hypothetical protein